MNWKFFGNANDGYAVSANPFSVRARMSVRRTRNGKGWEFRHGLVPRDSKRVRTSGSFALTTWRGEYATRQAAADAGFWSLVVDSPDVLETARKTPEFWSDSLQLAPVICPLCQGSGKLEENRVEGYSIAVPCPHLS